MSLQFDIQKSIPRSLGRVGALSTPHGVIHTPAFVVVGTKGTVKGLLPEDVKSAGAQVVLGNTYHLYLQPGEELIASSGGLHPFMRWQGPTMTDSGGFQVFSLGAAFDRSVSKVAEEGDTEEAEHKPQGQLANIDEDGVDFRSHIDGSLHRFTPESSIEIQHKIGADIIFAFDECTSPRASYEYQQQAMQRTHRWARRCLKRHTELGGEQSLFGVVQGGRFEDLRKESARVITAMEVEGESFDGFGIGGSFTKDDMATAVRWVNETLPEGKPRHLLGIGEPMDIFAGVENGCDLFDCVAPTRLGRNGTLYTKDGPIHISNANFRSDSTPIDSGCGCYVCENYDRRYIAHLFRAQEMLGPILGSLHNISFILSLMGQIRKAIHAGRFHEFRDNFCAQYYKK